MEPQMENKSNGTLIGVLVIVLIIILGGIYFFMSQNKELNTTEQEQTLDDNSNNNGDIIYSIDQLESELDSTNAEVDVNVDTIE